ncbi:MAG: putative transcriptional regulator [Rhodobacteraceae bacterium HLUCCA12]|nr:MAG: putative transcriptional regulator [Rhodobacteraceae bacterium HLUCCA12]
MSLTKARDLLRLAEMAAARYAGITLADISDEFGTDHRTSQRMVRALETVFDNVEITTDVERRRHWKLRDTRLVAMQGVRDSELVALEMSIRRATRDGAENEVRSLESLRDRLLATMPGAHARRAEADAEALLEAHGFASRPGPRTRAAPLVLETIAEALKGPFTLEITYAGMNTVDPTPRSLEPYGLLLGIRRYLVAKEPARDQAMRHYRLDRIRQARLGETLFRRDPDFNLNDHSARAFGSFHSDAEFGEVVWRFTPAAAKVARDFVFHPRQSFTEEPGGALTVRFQACGWLEMAWHLYQWGDAVEVLAPRELAEMVNSTQRGDFAALP